MVFDCAGVPFPTELIDDVWVFLPLRLIQRHVGLLSWPVLTAHIGLLFVVVHQAIYFWNSRKPDE
jgi:hypothetical protein